MNSYQYTSLGSTIPLAPLIKIQLTAPNPAPIFTFECTAFLDTGADCTLVPFEFLAQVQAKIAGSSERISGTSSGNIIVVPYFVGIKFDRYFSPLVRVRGCSGETLGKILLIGRDLLNQYYVEFDGINQIFIIR